MSPFVSLCFSLACPTSPFNLFLSIYLYIYIYIVIILLSSFLVIIFTSFCLGFLSWLVSLFLFHAKNNIERLLFKRLFSSILSVFWFPVFLFFPIPFSYLYFFPYLKTLGPTSPKPSLLWCFFFLFLFFISCVGFVSVAFALFC